MLRWTLVFGAVATAYAVWLWRPATAPEWSESDIGLMQSLWIEHLPPLPADPTNRVADDPRAARFGHALFFDPRLSGNGSVACITCHQPTRNFTDGRRKAQAIGTAKRNTPSIVGSAYSPWQYWDGRRDSLWAQALTPLEDPQEHGGNRLGYAHFVAEDERYRSEYEAIFGPLPDLSDRARFPEAASPLGDAEAKRAWETMDAEDQRAVNRVFSNIGKAIAAYERKLVHGPARFDAYVAAVVAGDTARQRDLFSNEEAQGLKLYLGQARCLECHNGPLFTNNEFHNTGILSFPGDLPDKGRADGLRQLRSDPFNCLGEYSDDPDPYCGELRFARSGIELIGALRTPSLRNLDRTEPFMHKGQLQTLAEIIAHYNDPPLAMIGHNEAEFPLSLTARERRQLEAFLGTLASPVAADPAWLAAPQKDTAMSQSAADEPRSATHRR